ncbi:MAG: TIGR02206 family membrane protein [Anaerolineaceae bacterium]|nr:TIGR02206 family membrane protein [Anaerolineaceae bacterium]
MNEFFAGDYHGAPFELFGTAHLIGLTIIVLFNLSFLLLKGKANTRLDKIFRYGMAAFLLIDEGLWHYWNAATGQWSLQTTLPLHICSIFVFLSAYMLVTKNEKIYEFAYLLGIATAAQALLTPDAGIYGFPHFRFFQVLLSHGLIVSSAIYLTIVHKFRPTWRSIPRVWAGIGIYAVIIFFLNIALGSNYLFINRKPATASLMDIMPPWPWYLLYLVVIATILFVLLYLPFAIKDRRSKAVENKIAEGRLADIAEN